MGSSPYGLLAYGYDLGGGGGGYTFRETGEFGDLNVDWFNYDDGPDFISACVDRLRASVGFTETDWDADGFFARRAAADAAIGVMFEQTGEHDQASWMLVTTIKTAEWDDTKVVDPQALINDPVTHDWDTKLGLALRVLGITPERDKPEWLLTSRYS